MTARRIGRLATSPSLAGLLFGVTRGAGQYLAVAALAAQTQAADDAAVV